jgi:acyl carrier protein
MTEAEVLSKLTDIFHDVFELPSIVLSPEMTAQDVQGWDSVNHITLVVETERSFDVKFLSTEIEALKNVGDLVRLIKTKTSK